MLNINTNLSSLIVQSSFKASTHGLNTAIERMTTGVRINHAKDNAANYSINTQLSTKISAYEVAEDNASHALNFLSTASGALDLISSSLSRLRALAEQSANGTYGDDSQRAINSEANALLSEIDRIYTTTQYNGLNVFTSEKEAEFESEVTRIDTSNLTCLSEVDSRVQLVSGTYAINSVEDLQQLAEMTNNSLVDSSSTFILGSNLDLRGINWMPIGSDRSHPFSATFDGNGYVISNLYINKPDGDAIGLFGRVEGGDIKNLGLENVNITAYSLIGGLAGGVYPNSGSGGTVYNCYVTGSVSGSYICVGGLIGQAGTGSRVELCYTDIIVSGSIGAGGLIGSCRGTNVVACHSGGSVLGGGGLVDSGDDKSVIQNCYSTANVTGRSTAGGILADGSSKIINCYSTGDISGVGFVGGLVGYYRGSEITGCYTTSNVKGAPSLSGNYSIGGLVGYVGSRSVSGTAPPISISNCYVLGESENLAGIFIGGCMNDANNSLISVKDSYYSPYYENSSVDNVGFTYANLEVSNISVYDGSPLFDYSVKENEPQNIYTFQVGISSDEASRISLNTSFSLSGLDSLSKIGIKDGNYLEKIDNLIQKVSAKQTEYGSAQNRLESVLEQISICYDNFVSTQSTIRDADISQESSEYIKYQILQQASATLLATANQTPAIALQLI